MRRRKTAVQGNTDKNSLPPQGRKFWPPGKKPALIFSSLLVVVIGGLLAWRVLPARADYVKQGNLVGYWPLNETSGTTATDVSGSGNDGTYNGNPTPSTNVPTTSFPDSHSLSFNGSSDVAKMSQLDFSTGTSPRTVSAWIYSTDHSATQRVPVAYGTCDATGSGHDGQAFGFYFDSSNDIHFWGCGTADFDTGVTIADNTWVNIAITYDGTNVQVYKDGVQAGAAQPRTLVGPTATTYFEVGGAQNMDSSGDYFTGQIDDVRVYNRALSATEISDLAAGDNTTATWTGTTSTDYNTASNWDIGAVPDAYTNIVIPSATNEPTLGGATGLANLTIDTGASLKLAGNNLTFNDGGTFSNSGTLYLDGNETLTNFTNDTDSGTVQYDGSNSFVNFTGLAAGNAYNNVLFTNQYDDSWTATADMTANGTFGVQYATFNTGNFNLTVGGTVSLYSYGSLNGGSSTIKVGGDWWEGSSSPFTGTSTVILDGTNQIIGQGGSNTFYNLSKVSSGNDTLTFRAGNTQTITHTLTLEGSGGYLSLVSTSPGTQWKIDPEGSVTAANLSVQDSDNLGAELGASGSSSAGNNTNWDFNSPDNPTSLGPTTSINGSWSNDATPTMTFSLSDPDASDTLKYWIQVYNNSSFSNAIIDYISGLGAQGSTSFTVGQAAGSGSYTIGSAGQTLPDGTYYWRVRAIDSGTLESGGFTLANAGSAAFMVDITPPSTPGTPSTASPANDATPAWTWTASTDSGSGLAATPYNVEWSQDSSFASGVTASTSGTVSFTQPTNLNDGTWYFRVQASDAAGNRSGWSTAASTTIDTGALAFNNVTAAAASNSSETITWETGTAASSQVSYGPTSSYGSATTPADTSPRVVSHSVTLTGLLPCTLYHFTVTSADASGNTDTSSDQSFITTGCAGSATVTTNSGSQISATSGGSLALGGNISISVPANFAGSDADFQIKQLDPTDAMQATGTPSGVTLASTNIYDLEALQNTATVISNFTHDITITMHYTAADITGLLESSLKIYRWDSGQGWRVLDNCADDASAKTVTCATPGFSTFALFGTATSQQTATSGSTSQTGSSQTQRSGAATPRGSTSQTNENAASSQSASNNGIPPTVQFENNSAKQNRNSKNTGALLGLGWWWLPIVAIALATWWLIATKRRKRQQTGR